MAQQTDSVDFETLWEQSIRLPAHKEISVEKIEVDLQITDLMDRYLEFSRQAVAQGEMKKEVLDELQARTASYKEALTKVNEGLIQRLARRIHTKHLFEQK